MRISNEAEILDARVRKRLLDEMKASENVARKAEYLRRYEVYKDQAKRHVVSALIAEGLKPATVAQMSNRAGNVSICRKIVNKKARAYSGGVRRQVEPEAAGEQLDELARLLSFDQKMKKGDRYRELHKNCFLKIVPEVDTHESVGEAKKYRLKFSVMAPWQYDVVEDFYDRELPLVVIISDFISRGAGGMGLPSTEARAGIHSSRTQVVTSDRKDGGLADSPDDAGMGERQEFVWWSGNYHFTTDAAGDVIPEKSPLGLLNPIGMLPFANNAEDQDGQFWAVGGDDLIDGAILVNKMITDMNFIAYLQGYGQIIITGKNLGKERPTWGPNNAIFLEYDPGNDEPAPSVDVLSASPPLEAWMRMVEQYMALLLTTNNLSPSNISGALTAQNFPSGIAMLIEQSESTDDVTDKQQDYVGQERQLWEITKRWQNIYEATGTLCSDFAAVGRLPDDLEVSIKFTEAKPAVSEAERLENIKRRKDLGINEMVDLIMIDNPDMTLAEAEEKLKRIMAQKLEAASQMMGSVIKDSEGPGEDEPKDDEDEDDVPPEEEPNVAS